MLAILTAGCGVNSRDATTWDVGADEAAIRQYFEALKRQYDFDVGKALNIEAATAYPTLTRDQYLKCRWGSDFPGVEKLNELKLVQEGRFTNLVPDPEWRPYPDGPQPSADGFRVYRADLVDTVSVGGETVQSATTKAHVAINKTGRVAQFLGCQLVPVAGSEHGATVAR